MEEDSEKPTDQVQAQDPLTVMAIAAAIDLAKTLDRLKDLGDKIERDTTIGAIDKASLQLLVVRRAAEIGRRKG